MHVCSTAQPGIERDREGETETENHEPRTLKRGKEGRILPFFLPEGVIYFD
jgi:hypothetical protein